MSRMTLNCFSTFFFEAGRFLQSTLGPLDMAGRASQISLEKPLSQLQGAKIAEEPTNSLDIFMGSEDLWSSCLPGKCSNH